MSRPRLAVSLALVALLLRGAAVAAAQDPADPPRAANAERARALYAEGAQATEEGRWSDAVDAFHAAFELTGAATARFSEAFALRALGRYRAAAEAFRAVADDERADAQLREESAALWSEVSVRVASISIETDSGPIEVAIDAEFRADTGIRPLRLQLDPGPHVLRVRRTGMLQFDASVRLAPGEQLSVPVVFAPVPVAPTRGESLLESPWLWTVVGVLVAAGAAIAAWQIDAALQVPAPGMVVIL